MRIDPPPSLPVQIGIMPDGDRRRRTARRTAGRALGVPRVAGHAVQVRAGPVRRAELGRRREPDEHRARAAQPRRPRCRRAVAISSSYSSDACVSGQPATAHELLHAHRHAGPRARDPRPRATAASISAARCRAPSTSRKQNAFSSGSKRSTRARKRSSSSSRVLAPRERRRRAPTRRVPRAPPSADRDLRNRYGLGRAETATLVWTISPELVLALDERSACPSTATSTVRRPGWSTSATSRSNGACTRSPGT